MRHIALALAFPAFLALTFPAVAAMTDWPAYADDVEASMAKLVGEIELFRIADETLKTVTSLAYQEGVAVLCPGFATDEGKRTDILSRFVPMRDEQFRQATVESMAIRSEVMFVFGAQFGATVASGKADTEAFCQRAESRRDDPGLVAPIWLPKG